MVAGLEPLPGETPAPNPGSRPHIRLVLATSLDGKLTDAARSPAHFGSAADRAHLEQQIAAVDAVLFGAGTLRAYETTLPVTHPDLLAQRQQAGLPPQPVQIVCSRTAIFDPRWRFFRQPLPRWLLTTAAAAAHWQGRAEFARVLAVPTTYDANSLVWPLALQHLVDLGIERLALLGGGELVAALLAVDAIDELHLTLCPLMFGGRTAPTPCDGQGLAMVAAPRWRLLQATPVGDEVFLHYVRAGDRR
ncbi:MAG: RibD family protein [Spirulinaceae cyanobacterium RM2_2_10]|nr:RibD family protein [Spirulinaceae cyanobacterium SM2_1_0]NJO21485.1 RibD family protein [Spirulinaceae cyanobacterium RM2_2_10]